MNFCIVILSLLLRSPNYFDWMSSLELCNLYIQGLRCPVLIYDVRRPVFSFGLYIQMVKFQARDMYPHSRLSVAHSVFVLEFGVVLSLDLLVRFP